MSPKRHGRKVPVRNIFDVDVVLEEHEKQDDHCPVCLEKWKKTKSIKLSACKHKLCKECARTLVLTSVKNGKIPILCPVCLAESEKCEKCMHFKRTMPPQRPVRETSAKVERCAYGVDHWCCSLDADVPQLLSEAECLDYSRRSLQAAVAKGGDLLPCPQTDCPGIAVRGKEDKGATCNACRYYWCLGCGNAWHPRKTCAQHLQEVRQQNEVVAEQNFTSYKAEQVVKRCSNCGHGLEKIGGCDHVMCAGCKSGWNFATLPRAV